MSLTDKPCPKTIIAPVIILHNSIDTYQEICWYGGMVYMESEFPHVLFAKDGEIYELAGKGRVAIGGAYSIDKHIRLAENMGWWEDEQPSTEIKTHVEQRLEQAGWNVDIVLSHTCPMKYIPREVFFRA